MINKNYLLSMIGAAVAFPLFVSAQIFVDTFDSDSSSDYDIFMGRDTSTVTFGWDYSQMGIPSAPRTTDGSTLGLLTVANDPARGGSFNEAVTLIPKISVT